MKKSKLALVSAGILSVIAISAISIKSFSNYENLKSAAANAHYSLPEGFSITAHTGCEDTDDNSLESITKGVAAQADIVEIDLHFLSDGTPVLSHDTPKSSRTYPTLESAFELLATLDAKMNVDVKSTANLPAVVSLAEKYGVTKKIFFTGVDENFVAAVKSDAPDIPYYLNVAVDKSRNTDSDYISSLISKVKAVGAIGINMNFKGASSELVNAFHDENLLVSLWTANKKTDMYRCLTFAPDNITTRKPSVLRDLLLDVYRK